MFLSSFIFILFFFNDPAPTEIYTLSLHDALPISTLCSITSASAPTCSSGSRTRTCSRDRKSTRLNSSHVSISYAVFCLKKKKSQGWLATLQRFVRFLRWVSSSQQLR